MTCVRHLRNRIDCSGSSRPDRRDDRASVAELEKFGPEPKLGVDWDLSQLELEEPRRLVHDGVSVLGADDHPSIRSQRPRHRE